jgi:hypothetical protein
LPAPHFRQLGNSYQGTFLAKMEEWSVQYLIVWHLLSPDQTDVGQ